MYGPGLEGVQKLISFSEKAFSNVQTEVIDVIAEDDRAATFFTYYAEHTGDMFGVPPTGKSFKEPIVHILRFEDSKVVEHWLVENELGMLRQLGLWPESLSYAPSTEDGKL